MTREEAEKLARVFETVDGGCSHCILGVCYAANESDLGFYWRPKKGDEYSVEVVTEKPELEW